MNLFFVCVSFVYSDIFVTRVESTMYQRKIKESNGHNRTVYWSKMTVIVTLLTEHNSATVVLIEGMDYGWLGSLEAISPSYKRQY